MKNLIYTIAIIFVLIGIFSIVNVPFFNFVIYVFSIPMVLPITFIVLGAIIFLLMAKLSHGIHIDTFDKHSWEIDQDLVETIKGRGMDVRKRL